jgi:hypothetical protein
MRICVVLVLALSIATHVDAQQIQLDQGVRAGGLWLFPSANDEHSFRYLPSDARVALNEQNKPQFSFLQYVKESNDAGAQPTGGGVLHMLVEYYTPPGKIAAAQAEIREILDDPDARIEGSIVFDNGSFFVTSSILAEEGVGLIGRAPVLEGNRVALSFSLDSTNAALLGKSLQMDTPDVSVTFDMTFSGLSDAYDASMHFDWQRVHSAMEASAKGTYFFIGADIKVEYDKLLQNQTIKFESRGKSGVTEALVNRAYERILKSMFDPVEPAKLEKKESDDLVGLLTNIVKEGAKSSVAQSVVGFHAGFKLKNIERTGTADLYFNHSETVSRDASIVLNVADIYKQYGQQPEFFRQVVIDSGPRNREVVLVIDGDLRPEFKKILNAVEIQFVKEHSDGTKTGDEVKLTDMSVEKPGHSFIYGLRANDGSEQLSYKYKIAWSFRGGGRLVEDWVSTETGFVDVYAPYERRQIPVIYDRDELSSQGVRAVQLELSYRFFDEDRSASLLIIPTQAQQQPNLELVMPRGQIDYEVRLKYTYSNGSTESKTETLSDSVIFVDGQI